MGRGVVNQRQSSRIRENRVRNSRRIACPLPTKRTTTFSRPYEHISALSNPSFSVPVVHSGFGRLVGGKHRCRAVRLADAIWFGKRALSAATSTSKPSSSRFKEQAFHRPPGRAETQMVYPHPLNSRSNRLAPPLSGRASGAELVCNHDGMRRPGIGLPTPSMRA